MGWDFALVIAGAAEAGWIDAVIGGGGLILIPLIIPTFPGIAPVTALATNKLAGFSGTFSAALRLAPHAKDYRKSLKLLVPIVALCSILGSAFAQVIPAAIMRPLAIVLLLVVGLFVALRPGFGTERTNKRPANTPLAALAVAMIAGYDGIFGPGTGMFLLISLVSSLAAVFVQATAMVKILNAATNIGALVMFIIGGHVWWQLGICLAIANVIGAQLGARTVVAGGARFIRFALLGMVVVMCGVLGWQQLN